jgi:magnesium transporter
VIHLILLSSLAGIFMLKCYSVKAKNLNELPKSSLNSSLHDVIWIDLYNPTSEDELFVENCLSINVPTRDEMNEIEVSRRLYKQPNAIFATLTIVSHAGSPEPESHNITFILHNKRLITVRYVDDPLFTVLIENSLLNNIVFLHGSSVLSCVLGGIRDQLADILENLSHNIEETSHKIFKTQKQDASHKPNFKKILLTIGDNEDLLSKSRESLFNLTRMLSFVAETPYFQAPEDYKAINLMMQDMPPLIEHANFLENKINFLLEATLGMINIEQNSIIKMVSVAAVVFLPPTLFASIYGMNFEFMPELKWVFGYPLALISIVLSAYLPYTYFKHKKWL